MAEENMTPTYFRNLILTAMCAVVNGCDGGDSVVSDEHHLLFDTVITVKHPENVIGLTVRNYSTDSAWILIGPANTPLAADAVQLARYLTSGISEDADRVKALFYHVAERLDYSRPINQGIDPHEPMRGLGVYGWGYCDDFAAIFANLCRAKGYPARVWGLSGHVVTEVFYDRGWHLFDPTTVRYLQNDSGTVLSYDEVNTTDLIKGLYPSNIHLPFRHALRTRKDNSVNDWWLTDDLYDATMVLPPGCEISFNRTTSFALHEILRDTIRDLQIQRGVGLMTVIAKPNDTKIHSHYSPFRVTEVEVVCHRLDIQKIDNISLCYANKLLSMEKYETVDSVRWRLTFNTFDETPVYKYELVSDSPAENLLFRGNIRTRFIFAPKALWPDKQGLTVQFVDRVALKSKSIQISFLSLASEE